MIRWGVEIGLATLLLTGCWWAFGGEAFYHFRLNRFFTRPRNTLPVFGLALALLCGSWQAKRIVKLGGSLLALAVLAVVFLTNVFGHWEPYVSCTHFTAVFNEVVQVYLGKALLIDDINQYGLYPHFLQPLFALTGLTVLKFTVVMGLLTALSYGLLWYFLSHSLSNQVVALLGFLALVFNGWLCFIYRLWDPLDDVYFQYHPIRFLFPACVVVLAWLYLRRPRRRLYWGIMVFQAAGVLWNLDAGAPAFLAWVGVLCFADLGQRGWRAGLRQSAGHLLAAGLVLAGVLLLWAGTMRLGYGAYPNFLEALRYQRLFYLAGFCMLPLPMPGAWMVVLLIYLVGLAHSLFALAAGRNTVKTQMSFLLSVLGSGLFTYYQGRSSAVVLTLAWWPSLLLLALFLDELLIQWKEGSRSPLRAVVGLVLLWFLAGSSWSLFADSKRFADMIAGRLQQALQPGSPAEQDVLLLRQVTSRGHPLLILSPRAPLLHLQVRVPSLAPAALNQLVLIEDFRHLCHALDQKPRALIFVENSLAGDSAVGPNTNLGTKMLLEELRTQYEVMAHTEHGFLYQRVNPPGTGHTEAGPSQPDCAGTRPAARLQFRPEAPLPTKVSRAETS
jgi:hypothetical protein